MTDSERQSPPVKDSDIIWLAVKKLKAAAHKMERFEYDEELEKILAEAASWFDWAAFNVNGRSGVPIVADDVDPYERAAIIVETLKNRNGDPADPDTMAEAIRAWKRQEAKTVSETAREEAKNL